MGFPYSRSINLSFAIIKLENVLYSGQITLSTAAAAVKSGVESALSFTVPYAGDVMAVQLTNNDASATIYLGYNNAVSSTNYWKSLTPGANLEEEMGRGTYNTLYAIASTGTPKLFVAVLA